MSCTEWHDPDELVLMLWRVREAPSCSPHYPASIAIGDTFDGRGNLVTIALDWRMSVVCTEALAMTGGEPVEVSVPSWAVIGTAPAVQA